MKFNASIFSRRISRGFTLIELLVVIAVIAILAALLLPALARAKLKATEADCLSNQHQMALSVMMYADDNSDYLSPFLGAGGYWQLSTPSPAAKATTAAQYLDLIQACLSSSSLGPNGWNPLFKYAASVGVNHCPGDTRVKKPLGHGLAFDSYSRTRNSDSEGPDTYFPGGAYNKLNQIDSTSLTFLFIEDTDSGGYNNGSWSVNGWNTNSGAFQWSDAPAMYHGNIGTFGLADGHAEFHKWQNANIINAGLSSANDTGGVRFNMASNPSLYPNASSHDADYNYIQYRFRFPGWVPLANP